MESRRSELIIFFTLFIGLCVLTFFVFRPFLQILALAAVLSVLFHPLYVRLTKGLHKGKSLMAVLIVTIAMVFLIIPILFLGLQIFAQAQDFFSATQANQGHSVQVLQESIDGLVHHIVPGLSFNISESISTALVTVFGSVGGLLSQTTYVVFQILFLLLAFFFILRDGDKMLKSLISLSPFGKEQNEEVIHSASLMITSVIRGTLFVGMIRFVLFAGAFYLFGIPNALLWGTIGGIIGMVPGLGTPFVIVPAFLYFMLKGDMFLAMGVGIFGVIISIFIDNMLSSYFFGKGSDFPPPFVLFSILGGVIFFGPLGFIFGPIILSLFISALDIYKMLVLKKP